LPTGNASGDTKDLRQSRLMMHRDDLLSKVCPESDQCVYAALAKL